jgi:hypothetical protein
MDVRAATTVHDWITITSGIRVGFESQHSRNVALPTYVERYFFWMAHVDQKDHHLDDGLWGSVEEAMVQPQ